MICFEVIFKGENVQGEAGPYRQFFSDISLELQPGSSGGRNLGLLMATGNNLAAVGEGRDQYMLNSEANTPYQLKLFEHLGFLMGCCIRTGTHLTLDLVPLVWKQIQEQPIQLSDFIEVDKLFCDLINFLETCDKEVFNYPF
jgi:other hect domain ubiquitin protein ligase E3